MFTLISYTLFTRKMLHDSANSYFILFVSIERNSGNFEFIVVLDFEIVFEMSF